MTHSSRKRKFQHENTRPEEQALRTAEILDNVAQVMAKHFGFMTQNIYSLHPDAKRLIAGPAGPEAIAEILQRRFDEMRFNGLESPDAPSLQAIVRAAVDRHPVRPDVSCSQVQQRGMTK